MMPMQGMRRAALIAAGSAAAVAFAVTLRVIWLIPARPTQLPGYARAHGFDAHAPLILMLLVVAGAFIGALAGHLLSRSLDGGWAYAATLTTLIAVPWLVIHGAGAGVVTICFIAVAAFVRFRKADIRITREDVATLAAFIPVYFGVLELFVGLAPAAAMVFSAVLVVAVRAFRPPIAMLAAAPAILLELDFMSTDAPLRAAIAIVAALALPFIVGEKIKPVRSIAYAVLLVGTAHVLMSAGAPVLNLFEHGFDLTPAAAMLRGARLYRDVLPDHGALGDGMLDAAAMRVFGPTAGAALGVRYAFALINIISFFILGIALCCVPEIAFAGVLLSFAFLPATLLSLGELAPMLVHRGWAGFLAMSLAALAVRRRSDRLLIAAGAMTAVAGLVSADFGIYATASLIAALVLRRTFVKPLLALAAVIAVFVAYLAATDSLGAFIRTMTRDMPHFVEAYSVGFPRFEAPEIGALIVIIGTFVLMLSRKRRFDPFFIAGAWMIASALGYAERRQIYFASLLGPIFIAAAFALIRYRRARAGIALIVALAFLANAGTMVVETAPDALRNRASDVARVYVKAEGTWLPKEDVPNLIRLGALLAKNLRRDETFYLFTNLASLHFLFRRPIPVRQPEVPMVETEDAQREVIARLEHNPRVTMVIEHYPYWSDTLDGVPNEVRAPFLHDWIVRRFPVRIEDNGIVVRLRTGRN
jgi:hypothetical protein